ncbi:unnamed protein product [Sphenostylis stenocarpa]|uniref:Uncharacterized protein n=1 Tax=Sphenostylis stenocarpa TaxID=92480 RepID=A0AA86W089_9FABA|nr:unnamed protein product [Sphenostylis stenocarpa]
MPPPTSLSPRHLALTTAPPALCRERPLITSSTFNPSQIATLCPSQSQPLPCGLPISTTITTSPNPSLHLLIHSLRLSLTAAPHSQSPLRLRRPPNPHPNHLRTTASIYPHSRSCREPATKCQVLATASKPAVPPHR